MITYGIKDVLSSVEFVKQGWDYSSSRGAIYYKVATGVMGTSNFVIYITVIIQSLYHVYDYAITFLSHLLPLI